MCVPKKLPSGHHSVPLAPQSHDQKEAYECGAHETGAGAQGGKPPKFTRQTPLPPMKIACLQSYHPASQVVLVVNNPPANAGDTGSIPGLERSPVEGHGNPLQYSCLDNPMDRGTGWATVHRIMIEGT